MTELQAVALPERPGRPPSLWQRREAAIQAIAAQIRIMADHAPGDLAALRRLEPDRLDRAAFWKLLARATPEEMDDAASHPRWAMIMGGMARMAPRHQGSARLGHALADAGFPEARFEQFLRARGDQVWPALRRLCAFLATRDDPAFDWRQPGMLLLAFDRDEDTAEMLRRRIARDYYARQHHNKDDERDSR